ncbi:lytic murein transglycosylase [Streptomyces sp. NPDC005438]|uniref:lytic transglycosylase domain-containing protein n=1 Tax=Streptomyces sp. NPDC005438 TaxID=3156880 RepID=UPI0033A53E9A
MGARYRGRHTARHAKPGASATVRRGTVGTAVAVLAMAALTASQAPALETAKDDQARPTPDQDVPGDDSYYTDLPPLKSPTPTQRPAPGDEGPRQSGIPATVLAAYQKAERSVRSSDPSCRLSWQLLAAIGKVESGQARGGAVDKDGTTLKPILGPVLNGQGFAQIEDTDNGALDGNSTYDRAVGPMQFIPGTWNRWGADGNGDGKRDPHNVFDAALAAGHYLCSGERDLKTKSGLDAAILSYNHSGEYLRTVLAWYEFYREGTHKVPDGKGPLPTSPATGGGPGGEGGKAGKGGGSAKPTGKPTPTDKPDSPTPTSKPTPTDKPSSPKPTPTDKPSDKPSPTPTDASPSPTGCPTDTGSPTPTESPTDSESPSPTETPTQKPTPTPTGSPTQTPTESPSDTASPTPTESDDPCGDGGEDDGKESDKPTPSPSPTTSSAAVGRVD